MTSAIPAGLISPGLISAGPIRTAVRDELAVLPARPAAAVPAHHGFDLLVTPDLPTNVELQNDVNAALQRSAAVDSTPGVSAHEGVVTLAGSVDDEVEVAAAQDVAEGVTEVAVEISLRRARD